MKQLMTGLLVSALLLVGGVPWAMADQISLKQSGGGVTPLGGVDDAAKVTAAESKFLTIASAVTTNTSTTPVAGVSGTKNFQWRVTGTGAVTQTVVLKGSFDSDGASPTDLCTITLSGTAPVYDVCAPFTAPFPYLFVTTTNTTGTSASGTGRVGY